MTDSVGETLSALLDGEPVDADQLADALESPDGRQLLVSFARTRATVAADAAAPTIEWRASMASRLATPRWATVDAISYRAAAALVAIALALGFAAERWRQHRPEAPPRAERVLQFDAADWHPTGGGQ